MPLVEPFATHDTDCTATGKQQADKIFNLMDIDKDGKLTFDEFAEGSKRDPKIVQVRTATTRHLCLLTILGPVLVPRSCLGYRSVL